MDSLIPCSVFGSSESHRPLEVGGLTVGWRRRY
jgi:hypothetical protein